MSRTAKIAIHWPRFGPYHYARLAYTADRLAGSGIHVTGLEIASNDKTYAWKPAAANASTAQVVSAFPDAYVEDLSFSRLYRRLSAVLREINPDLVAINGYSAKDAQAILLWCWLNGRPAVLMSDSKQDDFSRRWFKEAIKRLLVSQYAAGLCAGSQQREYLVQLGMNPGRILLGYDVVDNEYFGRGAQEARLNPELARGYPGLESAESYFLVTTRWIPRKNLTGILCAYHRYRMKVQGIGLNPWRLVVLGDGAQKDEIIKLVEREQIPGVAFPGFRQIEELPAYYGLASVFIHVPLQEQWGLVVNEAMASGLPVLVSKQCGCAPDLVVDGSNGFLVDAYDLSPLVEHMVNFTTGAYDAVAMGAASRAIIQNWGLERFARSLSELARMCVG